MKMVKEVCENMEKFTKTLRADYIREMLAAHSVQNIFVPPSAV
jgi:hypothetical protein